MAYNLVEKHRQIPTTIAVVKFKLN